MTEANDNNRQSKLDAAVLRFIEAQVRGDAPPVEDFVRQCPELEGEIRQKIASLSQVDSLFDSLRHADASDFPTQAAPRDLVGTQVGAFNVLEVIGRGGMGVVYKGRDSRLDRIVAIKAMPTHLLEDPTAEARFRREAKLLASLSHPNIGVIHDIIEQETGTYLILEHIPGPTLAERMADGPLALKEALPVGRQIAEAISAAHDKGVIHRDLKPGNIKITPDGRVKVLDFGLAKTTRDETADRDRTVTQTGRVIGTPAYMSPEQARGKRVDHRTDIWSFGCVMYEMLTGHLPFEGETSTDTIARILEREPDWELLPEDTPRNIRVLLRRCLTKDVNHRLRDIGDAAIEISETPSLPVTAPPAIVPVKRRRTATIVGAVIIIVLSGVAAWFALTQKTQPPSKGIRLVVLPFENLGLVEDEYIAASITHQMTSHLAPVRGLDVLSPRTASKYKTGERDIQAIGEKLSVDYILDGTVQRERPSDPNSQVLVMPQLIRAGDDTLLWTDSYLVYSEDNNELLRMQSVLAQQAAQALDVTLPEPQRRALASRRTENAEADRYYLRGYEFFNRSHQEHDFKLAIQMYEQAVEEDRTFALAHARLSMAHSWMYWFYDHSDARLTDAKEAADKAFELSPGLPEAHAALGRYYYSLLDFDSALEQFTIARESLPDDSEVLSNIGFCQRRQGKFEQALANIKRARELDPLSNKMSLQLAATFMLLRRYPEAEHYFEQGIQLSPDVAFGYFWKAGLYLQWQGDTEKARELFEQASQNSDTSKDEWIVLRSVMLDVFDEDYPGALNRLSSCESEAFVNQFYFVPKVLLAGQINGLMGNQQLARAHYESARNILEAKKQEQPEDARFRSSLGIVYAGLGRREDAIREGQLGVKLLPVTKDAWRGCYRVEDLARIYVMVGKFDAAIDRIEYLLKRPGELSVPLLRIDPAWGPLRNHPRFKKLIETGK